MFDYKQRPWSRPLTDEEYNRATGRIPRLPKPSPGLQEALDILAAQQPGLAPENDPDTGQ